MSGLQLQQMFLWQFPHTTVDYQMENLKCGSYRWRLSASTKMNVTNCTVEATESIITVRRNGSDGESHYNIVYFMCAAINLKKKEKKIQAIREKMQAAQC